MPDVVASAQSAQSSSFAPNEKFKRRIKSWVGANNSEVGPFGTVYEAISDEGFFFAVNEGFIDEGINAERSITQLEQMTKIKILKSTKGSVYWMAPEVVKPKIKWVGLHCTRNVNPPDTLS